MLPDLQGLKSLLLRSFSKVCGLLIKDVFRTPMADRKKKRKKIEERPLFQRKQRHPGKKCVKNEPIFYDELKKRISLTLTPTAIDILTELAEKHGISRSEYLEQKLRGIIND